MAYAADIEQLAGRAVAGDQRAMNDLLRVIQPEVLRRCARFLPCPQDAEEACQDVLLQVSRHIGGFAGRSKFTTWLYVVIANSSRQTYRSLKRRAAEQASADLPLNRPDPRTTSVIAGSRIDLLEALERLERDKPLMVAPLVLRDLGQLEYTAIAEQLGIAIGTVKSRLHEARRAVQQSLTGNHS